MSGLIGISHLRDGGIMREVYMAVGPPVYRSTTLKLRDHYTISGRLLAHDLSSCVGQVL